MKKFLFSFLFSLILFSKFNVTSDEPGGGDDEIDDDDLFGDNKDDDKDDDKDDQEGEDKDKIINDLKKRLENQEKITAHNENDKALNAAVNALKEKHEGFNWDEVQKYMSDLEKSDPDKYEILNNPIGFENVWNDIKPKEVENDDPILGREIKSDEKADEVLEKAAKGGSVSVDEQSQVLGKFF